MQTISVPEKEKRSWGEFEVLDIGKNYVVKKIIVYPKKMNSLQYHNHREEHWIIVSGEGKVVIGNKTLECKAGDYFHIRKKELHRIINDKDNPLVIIEVWRGELLREDDIERIEPSGDVK